MSWKSHFFFKVFTCEDLHRNFNQKKKIYIEITKKFFVTTDYNQINSTQAGDHQKAPPPWLKVRMAAHLARATISSPTVLLGNGVLRVVE